MFLSRSGKDQSRRIICSKEFSTQSNSELSDQTACLRFLSIAQWLLHRTLKGCFFLGSRRQSIEQHRRTRFAYLNPRHNLSRLNLQFRLPIYGYSYREQELLRGEYSCHPWTDLRTKSDRYRSNRSTLGHGLGLLSIVLAHSQMTLELGKTLHSLDLCMDGRSVTFRKICHLSFLPIDRFILHT